MALNRESESFGAGTRLGMSVQLALLVVLALAATVLVIGASEWRPLRLRADLTRTQFNTLDPQSLRILAELPQEVEIDVFFRPVPQPHTQAVAAVQRRAQDTLFLMTEVAGEKLRVTDHDLSRPAQVEARALELGLDRDNVIVVSSGGRRVVLRLLPDLGLVSQGSMDPTRPQPPEVIELRAEEALVEALGRVASPDPPRVVFAMGHGERRIDDTEAGGLAALARSLRNEGFEVSEWDPVHGGGVPEGTAILALVGPERPYTRGEIEDLRGFVARGGALLTATVRHLEDEGSFVDLLVPYGIRPMRGIVCVPVWDYRGRPMDGLAECATFVVGGSQLNIRHPVTQALAERERRLAVAFSRSFDRARVPAGGTVQQLVASPEESWRDLPGPDGQLDFRHDPASEELGRQALAMVAELPIDAEATRFARLVALGSPTFLSNEFFETNRDFALNTFNWLGDRDFRVRVRARDPFQSRIDPRRGPEMAWAARTAIWGLPGAALLFGFLLFLARRRQ